MPIPAVDKIWMNGKLVDWEDAKVHVLTHALHYGSGVFEGIRAYKTDKGAGVFRLTDHIQRLRRSAKLYYMEIPFHDHELVDATKATIVANKLDACYIRPIVFRGYGEMGLYPLKAPVETTIAVWPWGSYLGDEGVKHGIRTKISSFQALDHTSLARAAKACGQYLNSILAKVEVTNAGYDEAIMLDEHGHVAEGSGENLFIVRDGVIYTPYPSDGVLEGITRATVMDLAIDLGYEVKERTLARSDLIVADEVFLTGTAAEVVPVREIDDHVIGEPGPATRAIQDAYHKVVTGQIKKYAHFVEHVKA